MKRSLFSLVISSWMALGLISFAATPTPTPTPTPKVSVQEKKVPEGTTATSPSKVLISGKRTLDGSTPTLSPKTIAPVPPLLSPTSTPVQRGRTVKPGPKEWHRAAQQTKLFVYTQKGNATTRTSLGGEFPSQLSTSANVAGPFALQWARGKSGQEQKTGALTVYDSAGKVVGGPTASITVGAAATDLEFTFPVTATPGNYTAAVVEGDETSSKVTLNYTGAADTQVTPPTPGPVAVLVGSTCQIRLAQYKPMVGTSGHPDYQPAELSFEIQANAPAQIKEVRFDVYSKAFTSSEILTASGGTHPPIELFSGKWTFQEPIQPGTSGPNVVQLQPMTDYTKGGLGISSPSDWFTAYDKTDIATFKWTVDGQPIGSIEMPLHAAWAKQLWQEKTFQIPPPPKGPIKIPSKN
jgi:hypothetical protein